MKKVRFISSFFILVVLTLVVGCNTTTTETESSAAGGGNSEEVKKELKIGLDAQPPTLDQHITTSTSTRDAARLMFETLVTLDSKHQPVPMLAESIEVSDDSKTYTFSLREGVKFHNGEEMTAEDVVASMDRWMGLSAINGSVFEGATFEAEDDYTVILTLTEPSSLTLDLLGSAKQSAAIMPKEVIESADDKGVTEFIGTGPFEFVEWKQDQYIHFTKYEDYQPVEMEADGLAGKKEALVNDIYFYISSDSSTRISGLQSGEYDFVYGVPHDQYSLIDEDPNFEAYLMPGGTEIVFYNKTKGLASDVKMRQAINAALDFEAVMMAAIPNENLYSLTSSYIDEEIVNWYSDAGQEYYNQNDPEKAKKLLEEIGYDGEEFRILVTRDYAQHYNAAVVMQEQLSQIGLNIKMEVVDWPTLTDKMSNPDEFDAMVTGASHVSTPIQLITLSPSFALGTNNPDISEALYEIQTAPDLEEAQQLWNELQLYAWEDYLPVTLLGAYSNVYAGSANLEGVTTFNGAVFWNASVKE